MLRRLLGSKTRVDLLKLFIFNPKDEYFARQIQRITEDNFENIRKELIKLELLGLLKSRISGKQRYYFVNTAHPLFVDLKAIIFKTVGIGDAIRGAIEDRKDIDVAFIYGSYAKDTEDSTSDVDIFIIGDIASKDLQQEISKLEGETLREINYAIFSKQEIKEKLKKKNNFIVNVMKQPKIFIKGEENDLRKLGRNRKAYKVDAK